MRYVIIALTAASVTLAAPQPQASAGVYLSVSSRICPVGTHLGYRGHHCWPNHASVCPAGFHLGYEGKHCWRNH